MSTFAHLNLSHLHGIGLIPLAHAGEEHPAWHEAAKPADMPSVVPPPPPVFDSLREELGLPADICNRFLWGRCRYKRCRYVHDVEAAASFAALAQASASSSLSRSMASSSRAAVPPPPEELLSGDVGKVPPSSSKSWRSVDFLLRGESVNRNPYLKQFASSSWLPELLAAPESRSLFSIRGGSLRKELTEAFSLLHACKRGLAKLRGVGEHAAGQIPRSVISEATAQAVVVDLCCGKGFSSLVLALSMPKARIVALDKNPNMDLSHFCLAPNLSFEELDLVAPGVAEAWLDRVAKEATAAGLPLLVIGMHLCGSLSSRAAEIFGSLSAPPAAGACLVLVPCCLDGRRPFFKAQAKRLHLDPHRFWCMSLLLDLRDAGGREGVEQAAEEEICRREILIDDDVLSAKNTFLVATRRRVAGSVCAAAAA